MTKTESEERALAWLKAGVGLDFINNTYAGKKSLQEILRRDWELQQELSRDWTLHENHKSKPLVRRWLDRWDVATSELEDDAEWSEAPISPEEKAHLLEKILRGPGYRNNFVAQRMLAGEKLQDIVGNKIPPNTYTGEQIGRIIAPPSTHGGIYLLLAACGSALEAFVQMQYDNNPLPAIGTSLAGLAGAYMANRYLILDNYKKKKRELDASLGHLPDEPEPMLIHNPNYKPHIPLLGQD